MLVHDSTTNVMSNGRQAWLEALSYRPASRFSGRSPMNIVILGLSITSSWGNGHATTYRGLVRALVNRGHDVLFLERDAPWYAANRDLAQPPYGRTELYQDLADLKDRFASEVAGADLVFVGSYVPEGVDVGEWVIKIAQGMTAFYDIDTPVTLNKLLKGENEYLAPHLIRRYDCYLSFTGGPILEHLEQYYGARCARPLYCAVDETLYAPDPMTVAEFDLGYMGTYSADRQPGLEQLLLAPAEALAQAKFVVAGPSYPAGIAWPRNVARIEHLPPEQHRRFYNAQRYTLNVTRADMVRAGYSPSVRLFEAAACGVPIISDYWEGLESFFPLGEAILVARSSEDVLGYLRDLPEEARQEIGARARQVVLTQHSAAQRALELEETVHVIACSN